MIGVQNNSIYSIISNAQAKLKSTNMNAKKYKLLNKQQTSDRDKDDYDTLWVEDKDTSLDTKSVRNEEKVFKNRFNNIEKKNYESFISTIFRKNYISQEIKFRNEKY